MQDAFDYYLNVRDELDRKDKPINAYGYGEYCRKISCESIKR